MRWIARTTATLTVFATAYAAGFAESLPELPQGIGRPAADRTWWEPLKNTQEGAAVIRLAEKAQAAPMPAFDPERYLDFTTNGDRSRYQALHTQRWRRFTQLVIGECLEDKGRFVPAIVETVASLCSDPSWILPAHDAGAEVFKGASPYADLAVAANGHQMALAAWLLDGKLPASTSALMLENVRKRLTGPVLRTIDGTAPPNVRYGHWWAKCDHNWNAVCTAGALGAILATEPSREVRAKAIDWAAANMERFLSGFGADGYCSEGLGYWNYGFSHFVVLAELLRVQTGGRVDLYNSDAVRRIAAAPSALEIADGVYPAFADCRLDSKPDAQLLDMIRWRLDAQPFAGSPAAPLAASVPLYQTLTALEMRREAGGAAGKKPPAEPGLRSWFVPSGVFIARSSDAGGMAAAWKGGHNGEHHNHNDVGSTVIVWKGRPVIVDPGAMVYRAETFSKDRYRLPIMGSYGHSVPVVNGFLQSAGAACRGKIIRKQSGAARDSVAIDFASAYPQSGVRMLEREWIYQRDAGGGLEITDRFGFDQASTFGTALVTLGDWHLVERQERRTIFAADAGDGAVLLVEVTFSAPGTWEVTEIHNPEKPTARRLGLSLAGKAREGSISMRIRPAPDGVPASAEKLPASAAPDKLADALRAP